jgi:hypothetical protein
MKVRVIKAICQKGVRQEPGTVLELPDHEARESIHRGVVERVGPAPVVSGPMTTESVPVIVAGKTKRKTAPEE